MSVGRRTNKPSRDHIEAMRKIYGMMYIQARFRQACGCGQHADPITPGTKIVKWEGKWMSITCVDRILWDRGIDPITLLNKQEAVCQ
jgi:hypothetical protein